MDSMPLLPGPGSGGGARTSRISMATQLSHLLSLRSSTARVVLAAVVSVAWMVVSSALILVNKHILKDLNFP